MRIETSHELTNPEQFKKQLLLWAQRFDSQVWLESGHHFNENSRFEAILAVDEHSGIKVNKNCFESLSRYKNVTQDWIFGFLSYDLKNELESLDSNNLDELDFPLIHFFQPKKMFFLNKGELKASYLKDYQTDLEMDIENISKIETEIIGKTLGEPIKIKMRIFKDEYFSRVRQMKQHIYRGDIYEANFCQEFYAENYTLDPLWTYLKLNEISHAPFAAFCKFDEKFIICASPERYLKRTINKITSQPIKGTARRSEDNDVDANLRENLAQDQKELSENIMIVDMVRNDLSHTAIKGSVIVEELCKIYTYQQLHQMTSTISSQVLPHTDSVDIIKSTFPMGSMTGAPKISAMKLIEKFEETKRGVFSGAIGYFDPEDNFDFNVVIRTILYNSVKKYISYSVGSAITAKSDIGKEYEECLLKAKAMREVLEGN